ncbi:MAG: alpha/beta fold hydrolase [Neisseriaceae bacterium]
MNIAQLNDISIHYKVYGQNNDKTIILISGFSSDHKVWSLAIQVLAQKYKVVVFDNRGVGLTRDNEIPFDIEIMADDVYNLLSFLAVKNAHIIGHSMGGLIAQKFAIKYQQIIDKLVVINSSSYAYKTLEYVLSNQNKLWNKG